MQSVADGNSSKVIHDLLYFLQQEGSMHARKSGANTTVHDGRSLHCGAEAIAGQCDTDIPTGLIGNVCS